MKLKAVCTVVMISLVVLLTLPGPVLAEKIKVAGIYTQPIQQKWDACLYKALLKLADAGEIEYVYSEKVSNTDYILVLREYSEAQKFFKRLHSSILELASFNQWPLGVSIGVAVFRLPPSSPDEAIKIADTLMYKIKSSGKNSILFEEVGSASIKA